MKKLLFLVLALFVSIMATNAQAVIVGSENFDGSTVSFTSAGAVGATWAADTNYYVSAPKSYYGNVPTSLGDSIMLTTPIYDFTNYFLPYSSHSGFP